MRRKWTAEEIRILQEMTAGGIAPELIAQRLERSPEAVKVYLKKHGIPRVGRNTRWSAAEEAAFAEDWRDGEMSRLALQRKYRRTWSALQQRAQKHHLGPRPASDVYVTKSEVTKALGINERKLQSWVKRGLPAHRSKTNRTYGLMYDVDELLRFMERHQDDYDGSQVDESFFYQLPTWLREKRQADLSRGKENRKKNWTNEEDRRLMRLFLAGMTDKELSRELKRSEQAIRSRRFILGLSRKQAGESGET